MSKEIVYNVSSPARQKSRARENIFVNIHHFSTPQLT